MGLGLRVSTRVRIRLSLRVGFRVRVGVGVGVRVRVGVRFRVRVRVRDRSSPSVRPLRSVAAPNRQAATAGRLPSSRRCCARRRRQSPGVVAAAPPAIAAPASSRPAVLLSASCWLQQGFLQDSEMLGQQDMRRVDYCECQVGRPGQGWLGPSAIPLSDRRTFRRLSQLCCKVAVGYIRSGSSAAHPG